MSRRPPLPALPLVPRELHRSDRPSLTALAVTWTRALEAQRPAGERIVDDRLAALFLPPALQLALPAAARGQRLLDLPERLPVVGLQTYVAARHRFIDERLAAALRRTDPPVEQVVLLGAGYDTRAYRFADLLDGRPVFEVDLPPLSRLKASLVARNPAPFAAGSPTLVEIDFRTQALTDRLLECGLRPDRPTFVVWEGVAPYLDEAAVEATLEALAGLLGAGSELDVELWAGGGSGPLAPARRAAAWALSLIGEPVSFAVPEVGAAPLLGRYGFEVDDLADAAELTRRYATAGRRAAEALYLVAAELR